MGEDGEKSKCFPSKAVLTTPEGPRPMRDIQLGDMVLARTPEGKLIFTKVCHLTHNQPGVTMEVVVITMESGARLEVSSRHFVGREDEAGNLIYVLAEKIRPGDRMRTCTGPDQPDLLDTVKDVSWATASGKHALATDSGNHFVNGVLCSNYDECLPHAWAHFFMSPIRHAFHFCPSLVFWLNSRLTQEGIPVWASLVKNYVVPLLPIPSPAS